MAKKLISYDDEAEGLGLPAAVEGRLDTRFALKGDIPSGAVTSSSVTRIIASIDPNYPIQDGDMLLVYKEETYFFDLSTDGLSKLTPRLAESTRWTSETGYIKHASGSALRTGMSLSDLDALGTYDDVEVVAKLRAPKYSASFGPSVAVRGSGAAAEANLIVMSLSETGVSLGRYHNGSWYTWQTLPVTLPPNQWVWVRMSVQGDQILGRYWEDGSAEPDTWGMSATIPSSQPALLSPGWTGLLGASSAEQQWESIGVAADGATAPMVAP